MSVPKYVMHVKNLFAGYGETEILHGVDINISDGEIVCIIGPNGAGKSTVLKAILGQINVTQGSINLLEEDILSIPTSQIIKKGISYVPQTNNVFVSLSVEENLEMGAWVNPDDTQVKLNEMYELFPDLGDKRKQPAGSLSGGQRQMVAMAKSLMVEAKILLLDEPTAGLSPKYRAEIFSTIKKINRSGVPILMVEQNAKQALGVSDRGYILVDGSNRHDGTGKELLEDKEVARLFLGSRD
tara:strand:- start:47 stop:769 length:723 start_codon:yes stop_codon:yes gene_type:complete